MKSRTLLLTALLTIGFTFNNCDDPYDCGDFGDILDFFDIKDVSIAHMDSEMDYLDATTVSYEDYGSLQLRFVVDYIASAQEHNHFSFSLMNQAYSCTPPVPGSQGSKEESIDNITVITLNDFDDNHMANDTINDLMSAAYVYREEDIKSLEQFITESNTKVESELLSLSLNSRPTLDQEFQVRIRVDLSTGERYETISDPITFK